MKVTFDYLSEFERGVKALRKVAAAIVRTNLADFIKKGVVK